LELATDIREFFKRHEIPEITSMEFQLPDRQSMVTVLVTDLLERCFGVGENDSLMIYCSGIAMA